jgi:hypothetical protein
MADPHTPEIALKKAKEEIERSPDTPTITEWLLEIRLDHQGEPAAFVTIRLAPPPDGTFYSWKRYLQPISNQVWTQFRENQVPILPYVQFLVGDEQPADAEEEDFTMEAS